MKARKKGTELPLYSRAVVEMAIERLPDPGDVDTEYWTVDPKNLCIVFRRIPTTCERARGRGCYWKWDLVGRVEPARP